MSVSNTFKTSKTGKILLFLLEKYGHEQDYDEVIKEALELGLISPSKSKAAQLEVQIAALSEKYPSLSRKTLIRWIREDKEAAEKAVAEKEAAEKEAAEKAAAEKAATEKAAARKYQLLPQHLQLTPAQMAVAATKTKAARSPSPERSSSPDTWWSRQGHHNEQAGWNEYYRELNKP